MSQTPIHFVNRRSVLAGGGALAAGAVVPALAAAPQIGKQGPAFYRYRLGDFELTAIYDGLWLRDIDEKFLRNAPFADAEQVLSDTYQVARKLPSPITSLVVNTGSKLVVIDTGTGGQLSHAAPQTGVWLNNFLAAGIHPKDVDVVLISHFHFDHINGIRTKDGALVFPQAEIMVPAPEWKYWMDDARIEAAPEDRKPVFLNVKRIFASIAKNVTQFEPGAEVVPGITSIAAYGHTPGHTAYALSSGDQSMLVIGDAAEYPPMFLRHPEWQPVIDVDGPTAAQTQLKLLDRAAADRMLVQAYHFPFPASGYIARAATGYELNPVAWQTKL